MVGLLVLLFFGGYQWLRAYIRSDDFRITVNELVSEKLGTSVEFAPFTWDGLKVSSKSLSSVDDSLSADRLEAEVRLGGISRGVWEIPHVQIDALEIYQFQSEPKTPQDSPSDQTHSSFLPQEAEVRRVTIPSLSASLKELNVKNSSLVATAADGQAGFDIEITGGDILTKIPLFPEASLSSASIRLRGDSAYLTEAKATVHETGRVAMSGEFSQNGQWSIGGDISRFDCARILPEDWIKRLTGQISGRFSTKNETPVTGSIEITNGALTALPVLDTLAAYTDVLRFRRLSLHTAQCDFSIEGETQHFTNIQIINQGLVALEGSLTVRSRTLDGTFQLGVTPGTLVAIPGAEEKVFTTRRGGMIWTPLRISGTIDNPKEDLKERLYRAAQDRLFETLPESGQLVLKYSGEAAEENARRILEESSKILSNPTSPEQLIESSSTILEGGLDTIEKGVDDFLDVVPGGGIFRPKEN